MLTKTWGDDGRMNTGLAQPIGLRYPASPHPHTTDFNYIEPRDEQAR